MSAKILVVDDEVDLQELVKRKFRREIRRGEFEFEFANDGNEALEKVRQDPDIELILSDINMPGMDGLTLLEHLGEYEDHLRTIIVSAYGDMENIRTAMNRGAFDFVTKPIDFQDLLITVKKTLDQLDVLKEAIEDRMAAERARGNLARYFSPKMVETLAARDEPFGPPRQQNLAVLFADIRDFTTMSEAMSPAEVMAMLQGFHGCMEAVIFEHNGAMDKYIGDALLATFGTPDTGARDATDALTCAREMLAALDRWNEERTGSGQRP
ncbi:MAG: response regulator, partial [Hyphomicrobiales bacterium]